MSHPARIHSLSGSPKAQGREHGIHDRILAASAQLFLGKGFENVSVEEIITTAGIARSSFYRVFANREEVLSNIIRPLFERGIECLEAVKPGNSDEVLHGIFETYLTLWHMSTDALRLSTRTGGVHFELFRDLHGPFRDRLVALLASVDPQALANGNADYTARLIARTSVPIMEVYAGDRNFVTLFHQTMRALLLAPRGPESC